METIEDVREEIDALKTLMRAYFLTHEGHLRTFIIEKILRRPNGDWIKKAKEEGWL